jgi:hypothetical protein
MEFYLENLAQCKITSIDPNARTSQKQYAHSFIPCLQKEQTQHTHVKVVAEIKERENMRVLTRLKGSNRNKKGLFTGLDERMQLWHGIKFHIELSIVSLLCGFSGFLGRIFD